MADCDFYGLTLVFEPGALDEHPIPRFYGATLVFESGEVDESPVPRFYGMTLVFEGEYVPSAPVQMYGLTQMMEDYNPPDPMPEARDLWADFRRLLRDDSSFSARRHALLFKDEEKWSGAADWNAGNHRNTEVSGADGVIAKAGPYGGIWESPILENNYASKNPVWRDIFWKETLGQTTVEVRGSNISISDLKDRSWIEVTEAATNRDILHWYLWKWFQIRLVLPSEGVEVSQLRVHHQWDISDHVMRFGTLSFQRSIAARVFRAGDLRPILENRDGDFDYLREDPIYFGKEVEVWLGAEKEGKIYLFPFYVGYSDDWSWMEDVKEVELDTRNVFGKIKEWKVALQTETEPFRDQKILYGVQNYVAPRQDDEEKTKFYLDSKYDIASITAVYVNRIVQSGGWTYSLTAPGEIEFSAQPDGKVEVDFVGKTITNGIDIVLDLLTTEGGLDDEFDIDKDSFTEMASRVSGIVLSNVRIERENLFRAVVKILDSLNAVIYPDYLTQSRLAVHVFYPEYEIEYEDVALEDSSYAESRFARLRVRHSRGDWYNKVNAKYKAGLEAYTWLDQDAIDAYGLSVNEKEEYPYLSAQTDVFHVLEHFYYLLRKPLALYEFREAMPFFLTFNIRDYFNFYDPNGFVDTLEIFGLQKNFDDFSVPRLDGAKSYSTITNWAFAIDSESEDRKWYAIDTALPSDPNWSLRSYAF